MKNGTTPSHWVGNRRPALVGGAAFPAAAGPESVKSVMCRLPSFKFSMNFAGKLQGIRAAVLRPPGGVGRYLTLAPTTVSQFLVMASLDAPCSSSVGNTAFS